MVAGIDIVPGRMATVLALRACCPMGAHATAQGDITLIALRFPFSDYTATEQGKDAVN
mgnify:CR=1 FL=1